jgi:Glycosyltransferase family 87
LNSAPKLAFALSVVFAAGMWLYFERVLVPHQVIEAARRGTPRGTLSDLYPRWLGARELLLHGRDPYSPEVTREIQAGYYGRPLDANRPNDPRDQQAFAYPVYVAFLLAPTVKLPFTAVQEGFRWFLAALTLLTVFLWLRFVKWRPSPIMLGALGLLTLSSVAFIQGFKLQQLSLLVAGLIAGAVYLLTRNSQVFSGFLLALATIKPQLTLPMVAWLALWSLSRLRQRWKFLISFVITTVGLILAGEYVLPGWAGECWDAIGAYRKYTEPGGVLDQLLSAKIGHSVSMLIVVAVAVICVRRRTNPVGSNQFVWTTSLVLATTVVIVPTVAPYNQVLLLPGALLLACTCSRRATLAIRVLLAIAGACVIWPWITATALAAVSFVTADAQRFWFIPLWTNAMTPISLMACLLALVARCQPDSGGKIQVVEERKHLATGN